MLKANDVLLYYFRCNPLQEIGLLKFGLLHINVTLQFCGQSHQSGACYISSIQKLVSEGRQLQL